MTTMEQDSKAQAATLLKLIWRGIAANYKSRYRMTIWEQYENEIRSAAYTSSLGKFISRLCSRLAATVGRTDEERDVAETILRTANDREMLKLMREQTTLLVLMVRVDNQERREEWEAKQGEE
jgi:hypothetical protein